MASSLKYFYAVGRRKTAVAQVRLFMSTGESTVNGKPLNTYISRGDLFSFLFSPVKTA